MQTRPNTVTRYLQECVDNFSDGDRLERQGNLISYSNCGVLISKFDILTNTETTF